MRVSQGLAAVLLVMLLTTGLSGCVEEADNEPPRAIFQTEVSQVDVGDVVHFDAANSTDKDGSITSFHWDFGDGSETMGITAFHVYNTFGVYNVTLTVTDDLGKKSIFIQSIVVNALPKPVIGAEPEVQYIGGSIAFSGDASSDADGQVSAFLWDFGDGNGSAEPNPTHTYGTVGSYMVTLTVTDNRGAKATDTRFVRVKYRTYDVNFTLTGDNMPNQRDVTTEGMTTYLNITVDVANLHIIRFRLSWRDNIKPPGGDPNDLFQLTVIPPKGFGSSINGTEENLTLSFPMAGVPLNRTMDGESATAVRDEVMATVGSSLGTGVWLVQVEALECGGFRDADNTWIDDPGNYWDLAVHYEYFDVLVTEA